MKICNRLATGFATIVATIQVGGSESQLPPRPRSHPWLLQCKEACLQAGEPWLAWLERETGIPHDDATRWMNAVDERRQKKSTITHLRNGGQPDSEIPAVAELAVAEPAVAGNGFDLSTIYT
jgi:hypothetical protein